jgi:hypothetical protein
MTRVSTHTSAEDEDGVSAIEAVKVPAGDDSLGAEWTGMTTRLRAFLDAIAQARLSAAEAGELSVALADWLPWLGSRAVPNRCRLWGHWPNFPGRGQSLVPAIDVGVLDETHMEGIVRFGHFHSGENRVVHGGAVALLFDDAVGWLNLWADEPPGRTAYLNTSFRAVTPVDTDLQLEVDVVRKEGRKRFMRATLSLDGALCAEADALMIALFPGQP